jgi:hypothetical protein
LALAIAGRPMAHPLGYAFSGCTPSARSRRIHSSPGWTLAHEKAICYLSLGSWEDYRSDALSWPAARLGLVLADFPHEHWVDVRDLSALQPIIDARLSMCARTASTA